MLVESKTLYETDFNKWLEETVKKLQERDFTALDLDNLIEEVADLGRNQKHALESLLIKLFEHLLKLTYWESERDYQNFSQRTLLPKSNQDWISLSNFNNRKSDNYR